jgi:hypothetical protein
MTIGVIRSNVGGQCAVVAGASIIAWHVDVSKLTKYNQGTGTYIRTYIHTYIHDIHISLNPLPERLLSNPPSFSLPILIPPPSTLPLYRDPYYHPGPPFSETNIMQR